MNITRSREDSEHSLDSALTDWKQCSMAWVVTCANRWLFDRFERRSLDIVPNA